MPLFYQHNINQFTKLAVWRINEPEDFFLSKVSLQRDITHPHKRLQHLAGRYLLRFLFPDFPSDLIQIASTKKPYLPGDAFHFSISHCGDYAAAIVSKDQRVGIDIELPSVKVARIRHKFLHAVEWTAIESSYDKGFTVDVALDEQLIRRLTLLWSAKEAVFKWYGHGEVDFSEHIRLQPPDLTYPNSGIIPGSFLKNQSTDLELNYSNFENISLVWVVT